MPRFQILSLIGGGIRGAFVTSYLRELEQRLGRPIAECFDLIAGTSTGGIIAAGLSLGMSAEEMHDFYVRYGAQIFTPRPAYKAKGLMRPLFPIANWIFKRRTGSGLDSAFRARFCPHALQAAFDEGFADRTLRSVEFTRLIIPTVNLSRGQPHIFRSRHLPAGVRDQDLKIADVVIAATAAPTYFPHRQIGDDAYIDGGVWAADPSMLAFCESMRIQQFCTREGIDPAYSTKDIQLLSVGTGQAQFLHAIQQFCTREASTLLQHERHSAALCRHGAGAIFTQAAGRRRGVVVLGTPRCRRHGHITGRGPPSSIEVSVGRPLPARQLSHGTQMGARRS